MRRLIAALALTTVPTMAFAISGNDLLPLCASPSATGYVTGVMDTMIAAGADKGLCIPGKVTNGQMTDVVCKFLNDKPQHRHKMASVLTFEALSEAFPCH